MRRTGTGYMRGQNKLGPQRSRMLCLRYPRGTAEAGKKEKNGSITLTLLSTGIQGAASTDETSKLECGLATRHILSMCGPGLSPAPQSK